MKLLTVFLLFCCLAYPTSKTEDALRAQLAQQQAQLAKAQASLEALAKAQAASVAHNSRDISHNDQSISHNNQAINNVRTAQNDNAGKAQDAVSDAQDAVVDAVSANDKAVQTAIVMKGLQDQVLHTTDQNKFATYTLLITTVFGFLTLVATQLFKILTDSRSHKWEQDATAAHRRTELQKIDESTAQAKAAYNEANTVNLKLEKIGVQMKDGSQLKPGESAQEEQRYKDKAA